MGWKNILSFFVLAISVLVLIYIVGLGYIRVHEKIHQDTFARYEIKSKTEINPIWLSGFTIPETRDTCNDYCELQHALNDIIGYHVAVFIFNTWALFVAWFLYKRLYN